MAPKRIDATISIVHSGFKPKNRVSRNEVTDSRFLPGPPKKK
jgi:hypothetical protein